MSVKVPINYMIAIDKLKTSPTQKTQKKPKISAASPEYIVNTIL